MTLFPRRFAGEPAGRDGLVIFPYFVDKIRSHVVYVDEGVFCVRIVLSSISLEDVVVFDGAITPCNLAADLASRELSSFSVKSAVRTEASDPDDPRAPASAA